MAALGSKQQPHPLDLETTVPGAPGLRKRQAVDKPSRRSDLLIQSSALLLKLRQVQHELFLERWAGRTSCFAASSHLVPRDPHTGRYGEVVVQRAFKFGHQSSMTPQPLPELPEPSRTGTPGFPELPAPPLGGGRNGKDERDGVALDLFGLEQQQSRTLDRKKAAALLEVLQALRAHLVVGGVAFMARDYRDVRRELQALEGKT